MSVTFLDNKDKDELVASIGALSKEIENLENAAIEEIDIAVNGEGVVGTVLPSDITVYPWEGLFTAAQSGGKLILTRATENATSARIYYKIPVKHLDAIVLAKGENWTADGFQYEAMQCMSDGTVVAQPGRFFTADKDTVTFTASHPQVEVIYLGIRANPSTYTQVPKNWGVVNGDYGSAFKVYKPADMTEEYDQAICTSETVNGKIQLTQATATTMNARLYYTIPVKYGDTITITRSEGWTKSTFDYEPLLCSSDNTLLETPAFTTTSNSTISMQVSRLDAATVYLGIRYARDTAPADWGVIDDDFDSAFVVAKTSSVGDRTVFDGCSVKVDEAGYLKAEKASMSAPWINSAHRGLTSRVRENTIPAYYDGLLDGCKMFECDVRLTSDGIPVMCHDATVTGMVNGISTTLTISSTAYADLAKVVLTAASVYGDVGIPTFEETIQFAAYFGLKVMIDVKDNSDAGLAAVTNIVKKYNFSENAIYFIGSNPQDRYVKLLELDKRAKIVFYYSDDMSYIDDIASDASKVVIALQPSELSEVSASAIRSKGYGMHCWNVTASNCETAFSYYPDSVEYVTGVIVSPLIRKHLNNSKYAKYRRVQTL